jgi:hypothetical protein
MSLPCYAKINADCRGRSKVSLTIRDLIALPAQAEEICEVAEAFLRQWVPAVALSDEELEPQLATAQSRMGAPLPSALRWLYSRLGVSGRRLFQQDPIVDLESLMVDEDGVVTFRTEQQGCVEWGYTLVRTSRGGGAKRRRRLVMGTRPDQGRPASIDGPSSG